MAGAPRASHVDLGTHGVLTMPDLSDNPDLGRYELQVAESVAFVTYEMLDENRIVLLHTDVPEALSGQGIGSRLARSVLDDARRRGLSVVPQCKFIAAFIERHPEYRDLIA
jgi:uncharacterized protein